MYFIVVFWHILHKMENSAYQGCNLQSLVTQLYILLCLFSQKIFSPSFLTSLPGGTKSKPQVLLSSGRNHVRKDKEGTAAHEILNSKIFQKKL